MGENKHRFSSGTGHLEMKRTCRNEKVAGQFSVGREAGQNSLHAQPSDEQSGRLINGSSGGHTWNGMFLMASHREEHSLELAAIQRAIRMIKEHGEGVT